MHVIYVQLPPRASGRMSPEIRRQSLRSAGLGLAVCVCICFRVHDDCELLPDTRNAKSRIVVHSVTEKRITSETRRFPIKDDATKRTFTHLFRRLHGKKKKKLLTPSVGGYDVFV